MKKKRKMANMVRKEHAIRFGAGEMSISGIQEVTQQTSNTTDVTINSQIGFVIGFGPISALSGGTFAVNNSVVKADSIVECWFYAEGSDFARRGAVVCTDVSDGAFRLSWTNAFSGGTTVVAPRCFFKVFQRA